MGVCWGFFYNLFYTLVGGARTQFSHSFPVCLERAEGLFYSLFYTPAGGTRTQFCHSFSVCLDKPGGLLGGEVCEVIHVFSFLNNNN